MSIFFTSDTHFHHKGVITKKRHSWCSTVPEMNEMLIDDWNRSVQPGDFVYHMGDFAFAGLNKTVEIVRRLNGTIRLVPGNHDDKQMLRRMVEMGLIELLPPLFTLKVENHRFVLCHFPLMVWDRQQHGALHVHGHCHGHLPEDNARRADVGVDGPFGRSPVLLQTVANALYERPGEYLDHHTPKLKD